MASLQERRGWFHLLFRYQGKQYSHALKTKNRREAEAQRGSVDRILMRIENRELPPPPEHLDLVAFLLAGGKAIEPIRKSQPPITLKQLFERYCAAHQYGALEKSSLATARIHLKHIMDHLGESIAVKTLSADHLQDYLHARRQCRDTNGKMKTISPVTLRKEIATFRAAWNWAVSAELLAGNFPGSGLKFPKLEEKAPFQTREELERKIARGGLDDNQICELWSCLFLTKPELADFLTYVRKNAFHPFVYPMVAFAAHTGARRSELLRMLVDDVDLVGKTALVREKKRVRGRNSTRRVAISPFLHGVIDEWLKIHPGGQFLFCHEPQVFRSKKRRRGSDSLSALTRDEAHDHFQRTIKGSKWEVVKGWHVLRHSFISICAAEGVDQRMLQACVGHLSEETHKRYLHLIPSKERKEIARVFK